MKGETREIPNDILLPEVSRMVAEGHSVVLKTKGYSMLPFILGWMDSVELRLPDKPYAPGDIVLAEVRKGVFVLHRIVSIDGDKVVLHGDGNLVGIERCSVRDLRAKAYRIIKENGREKDCDTERAHRAARRWNALDVRVRRLALHYFRKLKYFHRTCK